MAAEKRKFAGRAPRYSLRPFHNKTITYSNSRLGEHQSTDFLNISSTGLAFVVQDSALPAFGSVISITFSIPEEENLTIKAQIVRLKKYKRPQWYKRYYNEESEVISESFLGVHFLNIKKTEQEKLANHLDRLIESEKLERKERKIAFLKDALQKNLLWVVISLTALVATGISLKHYFQP